MDNGWVSDNLYAILHNASVIKDAEKAINSIIDCNESGIWFEDEEGNHFVPKGHISVNYYQGVMNNDK